MHKVAISQKASAEKAPLWGGHNSISDTVRWGMNLVGGGSDATR